MKNIYERLVILQSGLHCQSYFNNHRKDSDLILPIGPEALYFCDKNNFENIKVKDLYEDEIYETDHTSSQEVLKNLVTDLNDYSRSINSSGALEIGNYFGFQLWIVIGQILYNYSIVRMVAKHFYKQKILLFKYSNEQSSLVFRPDPDNLLANILLTSKVFSSEQLELVELDRRTVFSLKKLLITPVIYYLRLGRDIMRISKIPLFKKNNKRLALIGGGYEWFKFIKNAKIKNNLKFNVERIKPPTLNYNNYPEILAIFNSNVFRDEREFYDFTLLSNLIGSYLDFFLANQEKVEQKLKKYVGAISSVLTFPEENFLAHMAVKNNLPLYLWQHGEKGQSHDETILYTELLYASDYFMYADLIKLDYQKWLGKNNFKQIHVVGSIEKEIDWRSECSNKVVYATGKWLFSATAFTDFVDPDTRIYLAHKDILNYLNHLNDKEVVFKANNTVGFNQIPYSRDYPKVNFDFKTPFINHLANADVIILDTPATTLVEACSTEVPIFVLAGRNKYRENFLELIKKRVVWCNSTEEMIQKLRLFFEEGIYDANTKDKSYFNSYISPERISKPQDQILKIFQKAL